jgi:hypothetical protein
LMHRIVDTLDTKCNLYWKCLVELKKCVYQYNQQCGTEYSFPRIFFIKGNLILVQMFLTYFLLLDVLFPLYCISLGISNSYWFCLDCIVFFYHILKILWPINSLPLSKVICVGHGYLENHSCSTILATVMDCLSS